MKSLAHTTAGEVQQVVEAAAALEAQSKGKGKGEYGKGKDKGKGKGKDRREHSREEAQGRRPGVHLSARSGSGSVRLRSADPSSPGPPRSRFRGDDDVTLVDNQGRDARGDDAADDRRPRGESGGSRGGTDSHSGTRRIWRAASSGDVPLGSDVRDHDRARDQGRRGGGDDRSRSARGHDAARGQ